MSRAGFQFLQASRWDEGRKKGIENAKTRQKVEREKEERKYWQREGGKDGRNKVGGKKEGGHERKEYNTKKKESEGGWVRRGRRGGIKYLVWVDKEPGTRVAFNSLWTRAHRRELRFIPANCKKTTGRRRHVRRTTLSPGRRNRWDPAGEEVCVGGGRRGETCVYSTVSCCFDLWK